MKKILFITYGGTHYKLFNILNKKFDVNFLMVKRFKKDFSNHLEHAKDINIEFADSKFKLLLKAIKETKNKDLIIAHCPISGAISYIATLFKNKKRVFLMCQDFYEYFSVAEENPVKRIIYGGLMKLFIKLSCKNSLVIALSQHIKNKATSYGAKNVKIIPVYGIDPAIFKPRKKKINFKTKDKIILSTSRLAPEKGLPYLLRAISQINGIKLVMAGMGDSGELRELIKTLSLKNKVILVGEVDPIKISDYYNSCDIFVLPSLKEGLGFASGEAMACKKPVIASKTGGIPDIVIHNKTGLLVSPGNVKELKDAIKKLISSPKLKKKLSENGHNHIRRNFLEKGVMDKFVKALNEY